MSDKYALKQANRLLQIDSPLGADALILRKLRVQEALSTPFTIDAEVLSQNHAIAPQSIIGKVITCIVHHEHVEDRFFNGVVRSFERVGTQGRDQSIYRIQAVPKLWRLGLTADCRIFQQKSVKQIVEALLGEGEVDSFRWAAGVGTAVRDYVVQYNETDLDFIHRLLAEIGVGYCFVHASGSHELVFCHATADWPTASGVTLKVMPNEDRIDVLASWRGAAALQPTKAVAVDTSLSAKNGRTEKTITTAVPHAGPAWMEMYLSPGNQALQTDVDPARTLLEAAEADATSSETKGRHPGIFAGARITIDAQDEAAETGNFLVTSALHEAYDETQLGGQGKDDYRNSFSVMSNERPWRPRRPRGRPPIPGLHRAIVTGPAAEEIHVDSLGRIKVQFLWDRYGQHDEHTSCWIRVMQPLAGAWGGTWFLPRKGDEVLVGFIDGEADRPVVVGSLYNSEGPPPFPLPGDKTKNGIRTKSSKNGSSSNFNMISLDDKKGSEHFEVQAEKDLTILVKNDRTETVKNNRTETIEGKHTETVTKDFSTKVTQGNHSLLVEMGKIDTTASMGNISTLAKMGNISTKADLGAITIEALQSITIKVGPSKMTMDMAGITLEGMTVTVKGSIMAATEAPMIKETAAALVKIQGGIVMIN